MKTRPIQLLCAALMLVFSLSALSDDDYSQAELNQLLAPIALYPDTVLSHVLIASTYPLEVVQAHRWAERHPGLDGGTAVAAAENEPWDPSVTALVAFPELLERMADDLDWTQRLGDAFLRDEEAVLASVQDLRQRAYSTGHLKTTEHQEVVVERQTIIVEPRTPDVIYIPYYDTRVVYGPWRWHHYPPTVWHRPHRGYWHSGIFWSFGTHIDNVYFYFSGFHWHQRHTVVIDLHHGHHRPRLHSSRSVVRYKESRRWRHNPTHRRGVDYRHRSVRQRYALPSRSDTRIRTDSGPERRHHRADTLGQRLKQSHPNRREHTPRLNRKAEKRAPANAADRNRSNRLEQRLGENRRNRAEPAAAERRRESRVERQSAPNSQRTRRDREPSINSRATRPHQQQRAEEQRQHRQQRHRQPERSQQNFQRSMRGRVESARNKRSITDRARQNRQGQQRSERH